MYSIFKRRTKLTTEQPLYQNGNTLKETDRQRVLEILSDLNIITGSHIGPLFMGNEIKPDFVITVYGYELQIVRKSNDNFIYFQRIR